MHVEVSCFQVFTIMKLKSNNRKIENKIPKPHAQHTIIGLFLLSFSIIVKHNDLYLVWITIYMRLDITEILTDTNQCYACYACIMFLQRANTLRKWKWKIQFRTSKNEKINMNVEVHLLRIIDLPLFFLPFPTSNNLQIFIHQAVFCVHLSSSNAVR